MMVPLTQLQVTGLRPRLDDALDTLQRLQVAEVVAVVEPGSPPADLAELAGRLDTLRALAGDDAACEHGPSGHGPSDGAVLADEALRELLDSLEPRVTELLAELEGLRNEAQSLPRFIDALDALQPLVPELGRLDDQQLASLGLVSIALVLDDPDERIVSELTRQLADLLGRGHLMAASAAAPGGPVGCLLVLRRRDLAQVNALLGTERIVQVGVPAAYAGRSLRATVEAMRVRLDSLPEEQARVQRLLDSTTTPVTASLDATAAALLARVERWEAANQADLSSRTFILRVWIPTERTALVERALANRLGSAVAVERRTSDGPDDDRPVLLRNRLGWQPFQQLVGFLSWPSRDGLDPTGLMALALPILFGVMVGDVVYGALLIAVAWGLRWRRPRASLVGQVARVLALGGGWTIVFGVLYGEALGSLGHSLGMPALWFYRGGPTALEPLLLFSLAVGLFHVVVGLLLAVWTALRGHHPRQLASKSGTLLTLGGLFGLAGVTAAGFPDALLTPAVAALVVGVVVACASQGALGLLLGPLGLLGTLGNVLSYLRLAAVGLASTYLAEVANQLGSRGPLLLGLLVATLFHALNLALAAFSPMVQALRLHYVEFFGQFHEGGGRLFAPLGGTPASAPQPHGIPAAQPRTTTKPVPVGSPV
jgi:V/A-type H+-transporting ATPase subunit I